jgi:hypothetical protein
MSTQKIWDFDEKMHPIQWTKWPIGALMGDGSLFGLDDYRN